MVCDCTCSIHIISNVLYAVDVYDFSTSAGFDFADDFDNLDHFRGKYLGGDIPDYQMAMVSYYYIKTSYKYIYFNLDWVGFIG